MKDRLQMRIVSCIVATSAFFFVVCSPGALARMQQQYEDHYSSFGARFDPNKNYTLAILPPIVNIKPDNANSVVGLHDFAILEMMKSRYFSPVERSRIDAALKEQEFGSSGLVNPETAARLGALTGADALMFVTVIESAHDDFFDSPEQRSAKLTVRIISSSTGDILYQGQGAASSFSGELDAWEQAFSLAVGKTKR